MMISAEWTAGPDPTPLSLLLDVMPRTESRKGR